MQRAVIPYALRNPAASGSGDVNLAEGFDIIQSVFDFYDDWQQNILELVLQRSYQDLVDACFRVFHNPMIMFDADCKVLGMSSQYGENDVDREWAYLSRHGYSSIQALEYMKSYYPDHDFEYEKILPFHFKGTILNCEGITGALIYQNEFFLRINVIEKERPLNYGIIRYWRCFCTLCISIWKRRREKRRRTLKILYSSVF